MDTLSLALLALWCVTAASHPLLRRASGACPPGWLARGQAPLRRGQGVGDRRWDGSHRERDTKSYVAAEAAVVSGLSSTLEGCSVPAEGATSGKRPGAGRAGKGALRRHRCAGCHDDRMAGREPPPPGLGAPAADSRQRAVEPRAGRAAARLGSLPSRPLPARRGEDPALG